MAGSSVTHESKGDAHDQASTTANGTGAAGRRPRRPLIIVAAIATAFVILGLALGLGLGLGLKNKHSSTATPGASSIGNTTANLQSVATPKSTDAFLSADVINDPPTMRAYDFVVEERMGAPDGVQKRMLVVNGQYPGPTIEANVGDRIVVNVTNKMPNST